MKKIMPALLLATVLFACKKNTSSDEGQSSDEPKYPVSFSISDFIVTTQNMRVAADPSLTKITNIYYYSFGSDNLRRTYITQDSTKTGFGIIKDTLPAGTYTIVICASTAPVTIGGGTNLTTSVTFGDFAPGTGQLNPLPEIFYKKIQVTIAPSGNAQQDVSLNRITGKISVLAYDALPATDPNGEVKLAMSQVRRYFNFNTGTIGTETASYDAWGARLSQTTLEANVLGGTYMQTNFWIHILYKDKTTGASKDKYFQDISLPANKRIDIKGYLYGVPDTTQGNYNIKVNSYYSDSTSYSLN
jgi:hypothetical protein